MNDKSKKSEMAIMFSNVALMFFIVFSVWAIVFMLNTPVRINSVMYNNTVINNNTITNNVMAYVPEERTEEMLNATIDERIKSTIQEPTNTTPALKVVGECMIVYEEDNSTLCLGIPYKGDVSE